MCLGDVRYQTCAKVKIISKTKLVTGKREFLSTNACTRQSGSKLMNRTEDQKY